MNAVAASLAPILPHVGEAFGRTSPGAQAMPPARVALLGTGTVGGAVLARLGGWAGTPLATRLQLVHVANSRISITNAAGLCPRDARDVLDPSPSGRGWREAPGEGQAERRILPIATNRKDDAFQVLADALGVPGPRIVIDATASELVADHHAQWLAQGIHVVTACKLGQGTSLARWRAIRAACTHSGARYGDSATVGAGLPLLRSIRELQAGGDRIHAIAGVLSGSLAWLFNHYDGLRPFSGFVREASDAGYTEPDPRDDLSGEDVRRKIVILARAAGVEIEAGDVEVDSLVPPALAALANGEVDAALPTLDAPMRERYAAAWKNGEKLRFIARLEHAHEGGSRARVGLEALPDSHPLAGGAGTDNRVAIWSDRYSRQPLVIQGPGAGAEVTAAGLLDDALRISHR